MANFFEHAQVAIHTSTFHENDIIHVDQRTGESLELGERVRGSERRLNGLWDFIERGIDDVCSGIKTIAKEVVDVVDTVATVVETVLTGDADANKVFTLDRISWNYDSSTGTAADKGIQIADQLTCSNCYANFDLGLHLELTISNYSFQRFASYLQGDVAYGIEGTLSASASCNSSAYIEVGVTHLKSQCITIGSVPLCAQTTIPVRVGYTMEAAGSVSIQVGGSTKGTVKYGILLDVGGGVRSVTHW